MLDSPIFDVLIVGAGPAGSHLALRLARRGWNVGLLDAKTFPRPKPCGEFMSPACLPYLEELSLLDEVWDAGAVALRGMRIHGHGHQVRGLYRTIGRNAVPHGGGLALRRERLDELTFRAAAAEPRVQTFVPWRVMSLLRDPTGRVRGLRAHSADGTERELRARFTIGADGRQSVVARELGLRRFPTEHARYAIVARFENVPRRPCGELHLTSGGYFACAPVDSDLFTLNLVLDRDAMPAGRPALEELLWSKIHATPSLALSLGEDARIHGPIRPIGPLEVKVSRRTFDGGALVGDAAGFVDPMTGEGIFLAMCGASHLAEALDHALSHGRTDASALQRYGQALGRDLTPRHRLAHLLQAGLGSERIERAVLSLLEKRRGIADLMVGMTGDYAPRGALLSPFVWARALAR